MAKLGPRDRQAKRDKLIIRGQLHEVSQGSGREGEVHGGEQRRTQLEIVADDRPGSSDHRRSADAEQ